MGKLLAEVWHYPVASMIDSFFAFFNVFHMSGGITGRWLSYRIKPRHPLFYVIFSILGAGVMVLWIPLLAPIAAFAVMFGDGLIYGSISRHIDAHTPKELNMLVISLWL